MHAEAKHRVATNDHAVIIAGGGPTGLMLAAELALARVDVAVVERRPTQELLGARAGGLHARTIELLDQRGVAERFLAQGQLHKLATFAIPLDLSDCPTRHNYVLGLQQAHIERTLAEWVAELGVPTYRGRAVIDFAQDDGGVDVALSDGGALRAEYLVGCDGGRSLIRKKAGIAFPGWDPYNGYFIAEFAVTSEPPWGLHRMERGNTAIGKIDDDPRRARLVVVEPYTGQSDEPTLEEVRAALIAAFGSDFGAHSPTWLSRFTDASRQAAAYRERRVLLAGDAAHIHSPHSGQGLNLGVQDAVNLGWKLAQVIRGVSPDRLLDTYHAERHPAGARVLRLTMAQTALHRGDERSKALHELVGELVRYDEPRRRIAAQVAGLDLRYDLGEGHPLLGRRMPDLELELSGSRTRVFALLHQARPLLLDLGERLGRGPAALDLSPWAGRIERVAARCAGPWQLPALGAVAAPSAVLVRPDGYVAWVGDGTETGLRAALATWCGAPEPGGEEDADR